ncbi:MAG: hypothetical protein WCF18_08450, partial [Chthoniobacteraceae bacterium]
MKPFSERRAPKTPLRWISGPALAAFASAGTDAHRICSSEEAWIERFGDDLLLSYKNEAARDETLAELPTWEAEHGLKHRRVFIKFIPLKNDERIAAVLIEGDASQMLETTVIENGMRFGLDFAAGYSAG